MSATAAHELRQRIVRLVCESAEGDLSEADLTEAGGSLAAVSYSSLATIRLIDAIENELGAYLEPEDTRLRTVDGIVEMVMENLPEAARA